MSNFWKWVLHSLVAMATFGLPLLMASNPAWLNLTLGGALTAFVQYLVATQTTVGFAKP